MHRIGSGSVVLLVLLGVGAQTGPPQIQNGRVEVRHATAIGRELAALPSRPGEPMWAGWREPIADGQRGGCCVYADDASAPGGVRGCFVDAPTAARQMPQVAVPAGPIPLEGGSRLVILVRLVDGQVERLRTLGDDCPLDAGGLPVLWLDGPTTADSLTFLGTLVGEPGPSVPAARQRVGEAALSGVALHQGAGADAILDRFATAASDSNLRRLARTLLGSRRGAHGFETLRRLLEGERLPEMRRQLVTAIGQTRQPATADALLAVAKQDMDAKVRAEAAYWLPQRGGAKFVGQLQTIIAADANDGVRQRAVQGLARLPDGDPVAVLLDLARTSDNLSVKKAAVGALGRSSDPRAVQYLEDLIRR